MAIQDPHGGPSNASESACPFSTPALTWQERTPSTTRSGSRTSETKGIPPQRADFIALTTNTVPTAPVMSHVEQCADHGRGCGPCLFAFGGLLVIKALCGGVLLVWHGNVGEDMEHPTEQEAEHGGAQATRCPGFGAQVLPESGQKHVFSRAMTKATNRCGTSINQATRGTYDQAPRAATPQRAAWIQVTITRPTLLSSGAGFTARRRSIPPPPLHGRLHRRL